MCIGHGVDTCADRNHVPPVLRMHLRLSPPGFSTRAWKFDSWCSAKDRSCILTLHRRHSGIPAFRHYSRMKTRLSHRSRLINRTFTAMFPITEAVSHSRSKPRHPPYSQHVKSKAMSCIPKQSLTHHGKILPNLLSLQSLSQVNWMLEIWEWKIKGTRGSTWSSTDPWQLLMVFDWLTGI